MTEEIHDCHKTKAPSAAEKLADSKFNSERFESFFGDNHLMKFENCVAVTTRLSLGGKEVAVLTFEGTIDKMIKPHLERVLGDHKDAILDLCGIPINDGVDLNLLLPYAKNRRLLFLFQATLHLVIEMLGLAGFSPMRQIWSLPWRNLTIGRVIEPFKLLSSRLVCKH